MIDNAEVSEQGMSEGSICSLIEGQIAQTYDATRMRMAWEKVLDGTTSPKVIARALVAALSHGRYERRMQPLTQVVNIYVSGATDSEKIAAVLGESLGSVPIRG